MTDEKQENRRRKELHSLKKEELLKLAVSLGCDVAMRSRKNIIHQILQKERGGVKQTTVQQEGKDITTTEHASGRKDVHIEVSMLDVKESDEATTNAKKVIEEKVLPKLADKDVLVIVIHRKTNDHAERVVKLPHVRAYAEAVLKSYRERDQYAQPEDFIVVEHNLTDQNVRVTTLV